MYSRPTRSEAQRHCRIFCRPIRTRFGDVAVRPISPTDDGLVQAFVAGLSGTSRYYRFFQPLKSLPQSMLDRLVRVDFASHVAVVALADVDGAQSIVAEARYVRHADGDTAEIALAVADDWRRRGIAAELLDMLQLIAGAAGVTRLIGECLAINTAFLRFASSAGFRITADGDDCGLRRVEKNLDEDAAFSDSTHMSAWTGGVDAMCAFAPESRW